MASSKDRYVLILVLLLLPCMKFCHDVSFYVYQWIEKTVLEGSTRNHHGAMK